MHLVAKLSIPFRVAFDLHEWVPDRAFAWRGIKDVQPLQRDFDGKEGVHSADQPETWESFEMMRTRMHRTLRTYRGYETVLVVCHGMVMRALTGQDRIRNTELIAYQLPE